MSPSWKKLVVSGSDAELNSLEVSEGIQANTVEVNNGTTEIILSSSLTTGIFDETRTLEPAIPLISHSGVSIEYTIQRDSATRNGVLMGSWSGSEVRYTDISNTDIGETWDLSFNMVRIGDDIRVRAYSLGSGSGTWTVHGLFKLFPNLA